MEIAVYFRFSLISSDGVVFWSSRADVSHDEVTPQRVVNVLLQGKSSLKYRHFHSDEIDELPRLSQTYTDIKHRLVYVIYTPVTHATGPICTVQFCAVITALNETFAKSINDWQFVADCVVLAITIGLSG